jgi:hypothetical protein
VLRSASVAAGDRDRGACLHQPMLTMEKHDDGNADADEPHLVSTAI